MLGLTPISAKEDVRSAGRACAGIWQRQKFCTESFKPDDVAVCESMPGDFAGAFHVFAGLKADLRDADTPIGKFAVWGRERIPYGRPRGPVIVLAGTELSAAWDIEHVCGKWVICMASLFSEPQPQSIISGDSRI